ncbi:MAG TPA: enolase C-terminal domain-like protein [Chloroflexota bacterium]|nr:enolase C-terminal domain-like protein [Chloroflexota bacterium]
MIDSTPGANARPDTGDVATGERVARLETHVYRIPTDRPEADGTYTWDATTMVLVEAVATSGARGLGYTYASATAAGVVHELLAQVVVGGPVDDVRAAWGAMIAMVRNVGRPGIAATAISAVDVALWDLKARLAGQPLYRLLGPHREAVPIYGSGGFTSYTVQELTEQLGGWVRQGIPRVKMKIGTDWGTRPEEDVVRVRAARQAIGPDAELFVDANGAYTVKQALAQAARFAEEGVTYFEEPVSSDQLEDLAFVRQHAPMAIAAGEYAYDPWYVRHMLGAGAVDIQQADATRCLGVTGWLEAAEIAHGFATPFSAHCAPSLHAQVGCAAPQLSHVEYFHDHARIERMLFDGAPQPAGGCLRPDPGRPGLGLDLRRQDAEQWRIAA